MSRVDVCFPTIADSGQGLFTSDTCSLLQPTACPTAGTVDAGDTVLRVHPALTGSSTFAGDTGVTNFVSYAANGQSPQSGTFNLCASNTAFDGRDIILNVGTGRPTVTIDPAPCS